MIHLTTERLILRDLEETDVEGIFALDSDPEVLRFIGTPALKDRPEAAERISGIRKQYEEHGIGRWAVELRETGAFIGWAGLKWEQHIRPFPYYDIGYRLIRKHWGQGYATEAAIACLRHGFEVLHYPEICAAAEAQHQASNHILRKIGLQQGEPFLFDGKLCNWYSLRKGVREQAADRGAGANGRRTNVV
ncbi:MAG TPA: GNAT family N-acetyltransferase [Flavobacteriales bacterium]|nr:GNAT family N-acetyltransferase [Flavobacteriales bacterium]